MFTDLTHRLRSLIRRRTVEQELDDELRFHRDRLVDRYVADGLPHVEAMRRSRLEMGGFDQVKEEHKDARGVRLLEDFGSDLRHAVRCQHVYFQCIEQRVVSTALYRRSGAPLDAQSRNERVLFLSRLRRYASTRASSLWPRGVIPDGIGSRSRWCERVRGRRGRVCELRWRAWRGPRPGTLVHERD